MIEKNYNLLDGNGITYSRLLFCNQCLLLYYIVVVRLLFFYYITWL